MLQKSKNVTLQLEWGFRKKINRENLKFGLKFSVWVPVTSGWWESPHKTFPGDVPQGRGDKMGITFERPAPEIIEGEKNL